MQEFITRIFFPILNPLFEPMNVWLASFFMPWARIVTLAFFIGTMIWVGIILKKDYVNLDAPSRTFCHDLRLWTVVSMLPHLFVYLYF
ncbi:MAG TPA: hypothetical protein ENN80_15580 [Candidatus Hydrogenedentes bacterium]|nr:hypothetical protein [Candidatus Hydrogenedentota bacterium]